MSHTVSNPYEQEPAVAVADANPYLGTHAAPAPDLDAGAPSLRNAEQQRVNRKALLFLGGIILLLMMMAALVFRGSSKSSDAAKPNEEQVSIPTLADATPPLPQQPQQVSNNVEPIAVQPTSQEMPPLPQQSYANTMPPPPPGYESPAQVRHEPTLMERRMGVDPNAMGAAGGSGGPQDAYSRALAMTQAAMGMHAPANDPNAVPEDATHKATAARALRNPDTLLVRGTLLRCVLETRIISEADGFTSCILTEPVYSINGRRLLLDRGSKIYGTYKARPKGNRIEVVWDRITTPNGYDVSMASPGVDPLGSAGYPGQLDAHWASRITSALMVSLLSDAFKYAAAKNGPESATVTQGVVVTNPYESNTANTLDRLANQAAEEGMAHAPTVTINQGSLVSVYVARDVDFTEVVGH
ncbi:secretion protein [Lysobacter sp. TY2-98]|uniref:TrbI/VirB10 family protein n=1 Tax=Lysobacter sp. TY2-98 TaxID=2290922 RepID=UPI000E2023B9|nr:TrbI/VirB10 family protein [Lysobacter sp. TY2-98]AXK72979.1 secretion protein [Lysobacter sp. TY2-98]